MIGVCFCIVLLFGMIFTRLLFVRIANFVLIGLSIVGSIGMIGGICFFVFLDWDDVLFIIYYIFYS